jgi:hypothetical protein
MSDDSNTPVADTLGELEQEVARLERQASTDDIDVGVHDDRAVVRLTYPRAQRGGGDE